MTSSPEACNPAAPADRLVTLPPWKPGTLTLGWEAIWWAREFLRHPDGPRAGLPWEYTEGQTLFVLWWYALRPDLRWMFQHGVRRHSKGTGKSPGGAALSLTELCGPVRFDRFCGIDQDDPRTWGGVRGKPVDMPLVQVAATSETQPLALDTAVPTPRGYTTVGALTPGDEVFGSDGRAVPVKHVTPVYYGHECYRVVFDDGEQIVASGSHGWTVARANSHDRKREIVTVTTGQMATDYLQNGGGARYTMPVVGVEYPKVDDLPVDPYFLGLWLGDGHKGDSSVAFDTACEQDVLRLVRETLQPQDVIAVRHGPGRQGVLRVRRQPRLCRWGHDWTDDGRLNGGQHLQCGQCLRDREKPKTGTPLLTMRERLRQAGVLGSKHIPAQYLRSHHDQRLALLQGLIDSDGMLDVKGRAQFVNRDLALLEQVRQLVVSLGFKATVQDDPTGARRLFFNPKDGRLVARLPYKMARHRTTEGGSSKERRIRLVERVPSVPVRCIGIDTEDHLFLAGWNNTLTHNTANTMRHVRAMTSKRSKVVREYSLDPGKTVIYTPDGGQLEQITSSAAAAEGALVTFAVEDEPEHWKPANGGTDLAAVLDRNLAKSNSRALETANAWEPGAGSVAEDTFDAWVAQEEGRTKSEALILYDAVVAPPDTDLADDVSLRAGVAHAYADAWWVDQQTIVDRILSLRTKPDVARRFYLNQPVASLDAWVTPQEWAVLADPSQVIGDGDEIVMFFDGSRTNDATALLGCHVETGYVFTIDVWESPPGLQLPGYTWEVPVHEVDAAVERAFDRWDVRAWFADVREWESFTKVEWPGRYGDGLEIWAVPGGKEPHAIAWDMRTHVFEFTMACELTLTEILERGFRHDGDSRLARHVVNARRHPNRHGVSIAKESRGSQKKIDAAVCMVGARMVRRLLLAKRASEPVKKPRSGRVHGFA